ncbi:M91 family zinc metallopeptidase [Streptomyces kronopolitis]|uniref:M91 family zinc metallopeptidase n=1 Tax=Streptomyces kronopolitis TaxID=1612435 RepID=UPI00367CFF8B
MPDEEMTKFLKDTAANIAVLKSRPNGKALIDFFSENIILQRGGRYLDRRIEAGSGERLSASVIISPVRLEKVKVDGIPLEFGKVTAHNISSGGIDAWTGTPSVIQYDPRLAVETETGKSGTFHGWPSDMLAHELVHAVHEASGTYSGSATVTIPENHFLGGILGKTYRVALEEVFTNSHPHARTHAGKAGRFVQIKVNGVSERSKLSSAEVGLEGVLSEKIRDGLDIDGQIQRALTARRKMFGIGECQIVREFGHDVRPMYNPPDKEQWIMRSWQISPGVDLARLAGEYPSMAEAVRAGIVTIVGSELFPPSIF